LRPLLSVRRSMGNLAWLKVGSVTEFDRRSDNPRLVICFNN